MLRNFFGPTPQSAAADLQRIKLAAERQAALTLARTAEPRTYDLGEFPTDIVSIFAFGCQGEGGVGQRQVAGLLNQLAQKRYMKSSIPEPTDISQAIAIETTASAAAVSSTPISQSPGVIEKISYSAATSSAHAAASPPCIDHVYAASTIRRGQNKRVAPTTKNTSGSIIGIDLGDRFYGKIVSTPDDDIFYTDYHTFYTDRKLGDALASDQNAVATLTPDPNAAALTLIAIFMVLGNHDLGLGDPEFIYKFNMNKAYLMLARENGLIQIAHSYFGNSNRAPLYDNHSNVRNSTDNSASLTPRTEAVVHPAPAIATNDKVRINPSDIPGYNNPSEYYAILLGKMLILMVNSNCYVHDFLENKPNNQTTWLYEQTTKARAAGLGTILFMHHPLYVFGKRAYSGDLRKYLSKKEILQVTALFPSLFKKATEPSYNAVLDEVIKSQGIKVNAVGAAHEHNLSFINRFNQGGDPRDNLCQFVSGGGGGKLQQRRHYGDTSASFFSKSHGAVELTFYPKYPEVIHFTFITLDSNGQEKHQIEFNTLSKDPIRLYPETMEASMRDEIHGFLNAIKSAIDAYFRYFHVNQEREQGGFLANREDGINRAHNLLAFISDIRTCSMEFADIVKEVYEITNQYYVFAPKSTSLISQVNAVIKSTYGSGCPTIADLHTEQQRLKVTSSTASAASWQLRSPRR